MLKSRIGHRDEKGRYITETHSIRDVMGKDHVICEEKTVKYDKNGERIEEIYRNKKDAYGFYTGLRLAEKKIGNNTTEYHIADKTVIVKDGKVTKCGDFDVTAWTKPKQSKDAEKYLDGFNDFSNTKYAVYYVVDTIHSQIKGPSRGDKTVAMVKTIPSEIFLDVLKSYKNEYGVSMFTDLMHEWGIKDNECADIAKQAFASYIQNKGKNVTPDDVMMAQYVQAGPKDGLKEYMSKIENYICK